MFKSLIAVSASLLICSNSMASTADVAAKLKEVTLDSELSLADIKAAHSSAGSNLSSEEGAELVRAVNGSLPGVKVADEAKEFLVDLGWKAYLEDLYPRERRMLSGGRTFAGSEYPAGVFEKLKSFLGLAKLAGAVTYDPQEVKVDKDLGFPRCFYDDHGNGVDVQPLNNALFYNDAGAGFKFEDLRLSYSEDWSDHVLVDKDGNSVGYSTDAQGNPPMFLGEDGKKYSWLQVSFKPKWTKHLNPQSVRPTESMSFDYTQIFPETLVDDLKDQTTVANWIDRQVTKTNIDGSKYSTWSYQQKKGGTGNIVTRYDEIYHEDNFARGRSGEKWASNCGLLADGTLHCVPASRRTRDRNVILTNHSLGRGRHMLYHGHVEARSAILTQVEVAGKLTTVARKGSGVLVNPYTILTKIWGFQSRTRLVFDSKGRGEPTLDHLTGTLREKE